MWKTLLLVVSMVAVVACNVVEMAERTPEGQYGRKVLADLTAKKVDALRSRLAPEITAEQAQHLSEMTALFPEADPQNVKLVGFQTSKDVTSGNATAAIAYQSSYEKHIFLTQMALRAAGQDYVIQTLQVEPLPAPLEELNAFTLRGTGLVQWLILLLAMTNVALSGIGVVLWFRVRKILRRRWLWLLATLLGVGAIVVNWRTGEISSLRLTFQLLGASFTKSGYGPWQMSASLPLGAIAFLLKWRRLRADATVEGPLDPIP